MRDRVTPELWNLIYDRDGGICVARQIDPGADTCRNQWGDPVRIERDGRMRRSEMTVDHVKDQARMGQRAPSDPKHLVLLCFHHNVNGWASAHRVEERTYLQEVNRD